MSVDEVLCNYEACLVGTQHEYYWRNDDHLSSKSIGRAKFTCKKSYRFVRTLRLVYSHYENKVICVSTLAVQPPVRIVPRSCTFPKESIIYNFEIWEIIVPKLPEISFE